MSKDTSAPDCRLYIISPPALDLILFKPTLEKALNAGDVAAFQLRLEQVDDTTVQRAIELLMPITQAHDVAFILNDRVDLCKKAGCDGVHLGKQDMPLREARARLGEDAIIGASCHDSRHDAMVAAERGASYVSFGPFFQTRTPFYPPEIYDPDRLADPNILSWWQETMEIPCVAAGGLTPEKCAPLIRAGADFICASTAIWEHPKGAAAAIKSFNSVISENRG